jgi:DNA-binding CsgD family transcriptional regulator
MKGDHIMDLSRPRALTYRHGSRKRRNRHAVFPYGPSPAYSLSACLREPDSSYDTHPSIEFLAVDLIGPSLLFQGLLSVVFDFEDVVCARLLATKPTHLSNRKLFLTLQDSLPLPALTVPVHRISLYWHSCWQNNIPQPFPEQLSPVVLYETAWSGENEPSVALSAYDTPATLHDGLRAAAAGYPFRSPQLIPNNSSPAPQSIHEPLSARETEVAQLVAAGLSNEEVANRLFVSVTTVKAHLQRAFRKLNVVRRSQLRDSLLSNGIITGLPSGAITYPEDDIAPDEPVDIICYTKEGFFVTAVP